MRRLFACIAVVLMCSAANAALASWWLVRSSGKCLVVDIEPTDKDKNATKIGKDVYQDPQIRPTPQGPELVRSFYASASLVCVEHRVQEVALNQKVALKW